MTDDISKWRNYFREIGLSAELYEKYSNYLEQCYQKKIPPIFERDHLALLLGRDVATINKIINSTNSFYRSFNLKKRSGGNRVILAPYPSLLESQKWIVDNILEKYETSICATAYKKKTSIFKNAKLHCNRDHVVKLDIVDFFGSIKFSRIMQVFVDFGYPRNVSYCLSKICSLNGSLPQGAATSPMLSNIICSKMDRAFYIYCRKRGYRYTRYSDDITISGKEIFKADLKRFFEMIESFGFLVNTKKFQILALGDKKIITGLDITTGKPRVTRAFRRQLMQDIYFAWSSGLATHMSRERLFEPTYLAQLQGRVRFWEEIEPESIQMKKVKLRLNDILKANSGLVVR